MPVAFVSDGSVPAQPHGCPLATAPPAAKPMPMRKSVSTLIAGCLLIALLSGCKATRPSGWEPSPIWKRDYMTDAMRQKPDSVYLVEYRWLTKPTGQFQMDIAKDYAVESWANRDARANLSSNIGAYQKKYEGREWWLAMRIIIAVDRKHPQAASLITPDSLSDLAQNMRAKLEGLPNPLDEKRDWQMIAELRRETPDIYKPTGIPWHDDQMTGSYLGGFTKALIPTVIDWYTRHGAPYDGAPHVVQNAWFWHAFVDQKDIASYVKRAQLQFEKDNAAYPHPLKILDIRTPLP